MTNCKSLSNYKLQWTFPCRNQINFGNRVVDADEYLRQRRQKQTKKKSGKRVQFKDPQ